MDHTLSLTLSILLVGSILAQDPRPLSYTIREDQGKGTLLGNVYNDARLYTLYNSTVKAQLEWSILVDNTGWNEYFTVSNQGLFRTDKVIDRETLCPSMEQCLANLDIQILPYMYFRIVKVVVEVLDVNDNPPRFVQSSVKLSLPESSTLGTALGVPAAVDLDSPKFGVQSYNIVPRTSTFDISYTLEEGEEEVYIILREYLDRESKDVYSFQLIATDGGSPPNSAIASIEIEVLDINDNSPTFDKDTYDVTVTENVPVGSAVITIQAKDPDQGSKIKYAFSSRSSAAFGDVFAIEEDTGTITTKTVIDYESEESYTLNIVARDESLLSLSAQATVIIKVRDLNDNAPNIVLNIFKGNSTHVMIEEGTDAGMSVAHIMVTDPDSGNSGKFNCFLSNNKFLLTQLSDNNFKIVSSTVLDREESARYEIMIRCDDRGNPVLHSNKTLVVLVTDINDNAPSFSQSLYRASMLLNSPAGTHILNVHATDKDEGLGGTLSYSIVEPMDQVFRVNISSGDIALKTAADFSSKKWVNFTVQASDHGIPGRSSIAHVVIDLIASVDVIPDFAQVLYSFSVPENVPVRTEVGTVSLLSSQHGLEIKYLFRVKTQPPENVFTIDQYSGKIFTSAIPDREKRESYDLVISAGVGGESRESITEVTIFIEDENDNTPELVFPRPGRDIVEISNQAPEGQPITQIEATDPDKAKNKLLTYMILSGNDKGYFGMDRDTGSLFLRKSIKSIKDEIFVIGILVQDEGRPPLSVEGELKVKVDHTLAPAASQDGGSPMNNTYMIIGIVCGLVVILVIVVVIVVIWQRKNAKKYKDIEDKMKRMEDSNNNADLVSTSGNLSDTGSRPSRNSFDSFDDPKFRFPQLNPPPDSDSGCSTDIPNTESSRGSTGSNNNIAPSFRPPMGPYGPGSLWQTQIPEDELYEENQHSNPHLSSSQEDNGGFSGFGGMRYPRGRSRYGVSYNPDPNRGYSSGEEMSGYMNRRPHSSMSYDGANPSRNMAQDFHRPYHSDGSRSSTPQELGRSHVYGHGRRRGGTTRGRQPGQRPSLEKTESWSSDSSAISSQPPLVTNNYNRLYKSQGDMLGSEQQQQQHSGDANRMVRSADWTPHQRPTPRYPDNRGYNNRGYSNQGYNPDPPKNNERYSMQDMGYYNNQGRRGFQGDPQRNNYNNYGQHPQQQQQQQQHGAGNYNQNGRYGDPYRSNQEHRSNNMGNQSNNNNYGRDQYSGQNGGFDRNYGGQPVRRQRQYDGNVGSAGSVRQKPIDSQRFRGILNLGDGDVIKELEVTV